MMFAGEYFSIRFYDQIYQHLLICSNDVQRSYGYLVWASVLISRLLVQLFRQLIVGVKDPRYINIWVNI
jgi:hypothetical protein